MKKILIGLGSIILVAGSIGVASATLINFDLADNLGGSSVTATGTPGGFWSGNGGSITANLASNLGDEFFSLDIGETKTVDFFSLTVSGISWAEDYTVEATLAFDVPNISASGSGGGEFTSLGFVSAGYLNWDTDSMPDYFFVGGDKIKVDFESGFAIGLLCNNTAMVHATITNLGAAPVPEPTTILFAGLGLAGIVGTRLRRKARRDSKEL